MHDFTQPPPTETEDEKRARALNQMVKVLRFSADFVSLIEDSQIKVAPKIKAIQMTMDQFAALAKKHELLIADYRRELLLQQFSRLFQEYGLSPCLVWEFAHIADHIIYNDVPERLRKPY